MLLVCTDRLKTEEQKYLLAYTEIKERRTNKYIGLDIVACRRDGDGADMTVVPTDNLESLYSDGHPVRNFVLKDNYGWGGEGHPIKVFHISWPWASASLYASAYRQTKSWSTTKVN